MYLHVFMSYSTCLRDKGERERNEEYRIAGNFGGS